MKIQCEVLINRGKHGDFIVLFDKDNPLDAYYKMFLHFEALGYYSFLEVSLEKSDEKTAYSRAKNGDKAMAYWLTQLRSDAEYEGVQHEVVY